MEIDVTCKCGATLKMRYGSEQQVSGATRFYEWIEVHKECVQHKPMPEQTVFNSDPFCEKCGACHPIMPKCPSRPQNQGRNDA